MLITCKRLDEVRRIITDNDRDNPLLNRISALTMAAAVELTCAAWEWKRLNIETGLKFYSALTKKFPALQTLSAALAQGHSAKRSGKATFAAFPNDLCTVRSREDLLSDDFQLFKMRFSKALQGAGFGRDLSPAIAAALGEMSDNVVQHSKQDTAFGLIAYHVTERAMIFSVADVGRGVLASLTTNPIWNNLRSHQQALEAAICNHATSRLDAREGGGFKLLHRSLASHRGALRFRSGDALLTLSGMVEPKRGQLSSVAPLVGFQLSVGCDLDQKNHKFVLTHFVK